MGHEIARRLTVPLLVGAACVLGVGAHGCGKDGGAGGDAAPGMDGSAASDGAASAGWAARASLPAARQETGVAELGGRVYVVGGFTADRRIVATVEVYDPATDAWSEVASLPVALHHANTAAADGKLYVLGYLEGLAFAARGRVFAYDPATDAWTEKASMPVGTERGSSAVGVIGDRIYVAGGQNGATSLATFSAYDVGDDAWISLPDLPAARDHLVGGAVGGVFYAIGGRSGGIGGIQARVDAFDTQTGAWSPRAAMPTARGGMAAAVVGGRIHVAGGEGNPETGSGGVFSAHEAYDPSTDMWEILPPMLTPRHGTGGAAVGGAFHIPGGATVQGFGAVATHEVYSP